MQSIYLAGGCFWCIEAVFLNIKGVDKVIPGYIGGTTKNPTYSQICEGNTGHAEAIKCIYNEEYIDLEKILEIFLNVIINGIKENKSTELRGFGRFSTKIIKEKRNARNPRTGEKIHIEARKYISFKMAKELKEKINKNRFIN